MSNHHHHQRGAISSPLLRLGRQIAVAHPPSVEKQQGAQAPEQDFAAARYGVMPVLVPVTEEAASSEAVVVESSVEESLVLRTRLELRTTPCSIR